MIWECFLEISPYIRTIQQKCLVNRWPHQDERATICWRELKLLIVVFSWFSIIGFICIQTKVTSCYATSPFCLSDRDFSDVTDQITNHWQLSRCVAISYGCAAIWWSLESALSTDRLEIALADSHLFVRRVATCSAFESITCRKTPRFHTPIQPESDKFATICARKSWIVGTERQDTRKNKIGRDITATFAT
jgi:hypothetical protein